MFAIVIVAIGLSWYTWIWTRKRLKNHLIICVDNDVNRRILSRCPRMKGYRLPFPYAHPIIHSIVSATLREHVPDLPKYFRIPVQLACGAGVSIDWAVDKVDPKKKTVLLLHGINGHSMASYCKHMVREATRRGYQCVLMNNRGCGGNQLYTAVSFNAARTSDLRQVVALLRSKYIDKETPLYMIGFSMGGTVLIRFLSQESGNRDLVQGAVAISTNFNMDRTAAHMERPLSFSRHVLNRGFCLRMLQWFRQHEHVFRETSIDIQRVYSCRTLRDYDELVNVPTSEEFSSVAEYYAACSTDDKVGLVTAPLLCIQSEDDPICLANSIPIDAFRRNPNIIMNVVPGGGHVGFLEEVKLNSTSWIEDCAMDYFDALEVEHQQAIAPY